MERSNTDFEFVAVDIDAASNSFLSEIEKDEAPTIDDSAIGSSLAENDFQQDLSDLNVEIIEEEPLPTSDYKNNETNVDYESQNEEMSTGSEIEEVTNSEPTKPEEPPKLNYAKQKKKKKRRKGTTPSLLCKECGYEGQATKDMKRHARTHTGEKPYVCSICNFRTAHPSSYRRHLNIHNGIKPYACTECNYRSAYRHHLESHLSHHTGVKPFSCTLCSYRTAYRHHLENHQSVHTGVKKVRPAQSDQISYVDESQYNGLIVDDDREDTGTNGEYDHQRHFMALVSDDLVTTELTEGSIPLLP